MLCVSVCVWEREDSIVIIHFPLSYRCSIPTHHFTPLERKLTQILWWWHVYQLLQHFLYPWLWHYNTSPSTQDVTDVFSPYKPSSIQSQDCWSLYQIWLSSSTGTKPFPEITKNTSYNRITKTWPHFFKLHCTLSLLTTINAKYNFSGPMKWENDYIIN